MKSVDLRKPHHWYPVARSLKRNFIYHAGPTNSGKTYNALQARLHYCKKSATQNFCRFPWPHSTCLLVITEKWPHSNCRSAWKSLRLVACWIHMCTYPFTCAEDDGSRQWCLLWASKAAGNGGIRHLQCSGDLLQFGDRWVINLQMLAVSCNWFEQQSLLISSYLWPIAWIAPNLHSMLILN